MFHQFHSQVAPSEVLEQGPTYLLLWGLLLVEDGPRLLVDGVGRVRLLGHACEGLLVPLEVGRGRLLEPGAAVEGVVRGGLLAEVCKVAPLPPPGGAN